MASRCTSRYANFYVSGNFNAQNNSTILITPGASLRLYVGSTSGSAVAATFGIVNSFGNAFNFQMFGLPTCTSVTITGGNVYLGTFYAPKAELTSFGGGTGSSVDCQGAFAVQSISMNGHSSFHFDQNLKRNGPVR